MVVFAGAEDGVEEPLHDVHPLKRQWRETSQKISLSVCVGHVGVRQWSLQEEFLESRHHLTKI